MSIFTRGIAPVAQRLGTEHVIQLWLGAVLVWDGTVPAQLSAPTATATATAAAPGVTADAPSLVPPPAAATASPPSPAPQVSGSVTVQAAAASAAATLDPSVTGDSVIEVPVATAGAATPSPLSDATIGAPPASATAQSPVPDVATTGSQVVGAPVASAVAQAAVPNVAAAVPVSAPAATAGAATPVPTPQVSHAIAPAAASASASVVAPVVAAVNFQPSGMNKSATANAANAWTDITGWTADATGYPGSTVNSNLSLVANGTKTGATLRAEVPFAPGGAYFSGTGFQIRIMVNGVVAQTGTGVAANSGTAICEITTNIANGDLVKVQANANNSFTIVPVIQQTGTFLHIT